MRVKQEVRRELGGSFTDSIVSKRYAGVKRIPVAVISDTYIEIISVKVLFRLSLGSFV